MIESGIQATRRLARNTVALSAVRVGHVVLSMILSLLIARLLGVEGFGKYSVLTAYFGIFQSLAMMGVPRLVVREMARQPGSGPQWFQRALVNQSIGALVGGGLLVFVATQLRHPPDTTRALFVVALSLLPFAISSACEAAFQALERMAYITLAQLVGGAFQIAGSAWLLLRGGGIEELAWMIVLWQVIAATIEFVLATQLGLLRSFRVQLRSALTLFADAFYFFLLSISVVIFSRLDVLALSQLVGEEAVGIYNAAYLVVRSLNFVAVGYGDSVYPMLSRYFHKDSSRFKQVLCKSLSLGSAATLLATVLLFVLAEPVVHIIYNDVAYQEAVHVLRVVSPFVVIFFWNTLLSGALMAGDLQRRSVVVSVTKLVVGVGLYLALTIWLGVMGTALATVLAGFLGTLLNYYFLSKEIYALDIARLVGKPLALAVIVLALLWGVRVWPWPLLAGGGVLLYIAGLVLARVISREDWKLARQILKPSR